MVVLELVEDEVEVPPGAVVLVVVVLWVVVVVVVDAPPEIISKFLTLSVIVESTPPTL
ncbi:MAG: hypothetical protein JRJ29_11755 [Deltaproteobacteria bacterium]|nr:hypothetical protein [Deltaproteobacteria bacterium]